jgi:hypothetical protein
MLAVQLRRQWQDVQKNCVPHLRQQIVFSATTAYDMVDDDLSLFPYRKQLSHPLSEDRGVKVCEGICSGVVDIASVLNTIRSPGEGHFLLGCYFNKL